MRRQLLALALVGVMSSAVACGDGNEPTTTTTEDPATTVSIQPTTTATTSTTAVALAVARAGARLTADPGAIAEEIMRNERAIRDPETPDADIEALAVAQQLAYRRASVDSATSSAVVARVQPELREVARANVTATSDLRRLTKPRTSLPPWRIVRPAPPSELLSYYQEAESRYGVGWEYLAAIHLVETRMGRIRGDSSAGARGPMQFLPSTWGQYGEGGNIEDNRDSIMAAARMLKRNGAPQRMNDALFAYNRSKLYVNGVTLYAQQMRASPRAYLAYHHWQVWYRLESGDVMLPVGYPEQRPIKA